MRPFSKGNWVRARQSVTWPVAYQRWLVASRLQVVALMPGKPTVLVRIEGTHDDLEVDESFLERVDPPASDPFCVPCGGFRGHKLGCPVACAEDPKLPAAQNGTHVIDWLTFIRPLQRKVYWSPP
jgi:hypothetical protein